MRFDTGDTVTWTWGTGTAEGKVTEVFTQKVTKKIKGKDITRNANADEPAYLIRQDDGDTVLKSGSELAKGCPSTRTAPRAGCGRTLHGSPAFGRMPGKMKADTGGTFLQPMGLLYKAMHPARVPMKPRQDEAVSS